MMDAAGVHGAVIHPPGWDPGSNAMAFKAVADYPGRFAIMGSLPLEDPASRGKIARWRDQPGMLGLRYTFTDKQEQRQLQEGHLDWLFEEAEKAGVPIAALCTDSLAQFGQIAERHPDLKITIDHLGGRGGTTTLKDAASMTPYSRFAGVGEASQYRCKSNGRTWIFERAVPVPGHAYISGADLSGVRPGAHVLGDGHHQNAVLMAAMCGDVHGGTAVHCLGRLATDHGPVHSGLVGLGPRLIGLGFGSVRLFPRDRLAADDSALCWIEG